MPSSNNSPSLSPPPKTTDTLNVMNPDDKQRSLIQSKSFKERRSFGEYNKLYWSNGVCILIICSVRMSEVHAQSSYAIWHLRLLLYTSNYHNCTCIFSSWMYVDYISVLFVCQICQIYLHAFSNTRIFRWGIVDMHMNAWHIWHAYRNACIVKSLHKKHYKTEHVING